MRRAGIILLTLAIVAVLAKFLFLPSTAATPPLTVFCAAGLKKPVEAIAAQYREETGREVSLQYGGTGTLLSQLRIAKKGDLFITADEGSMADARKFGVVAESRPLVAQHPVIVVAKGNPRGIRGLDDLLKPEVRLALPNPEAASIGRVCKALLGPRWDALAAKSAVMKLTVMEIASDVKLGSADAALVWDHVVRQFPDLEAVTVPELSARRENAGVAVLAFSTQAAAARAFADYLTAREKGGAIFARQGYQLPDPPNPAP